MLEADTKRPWSLKQRIRGRHGHLSNQTTLNSWNPSKTLPERVFLMHLNRDCNNVEEVKEKFGNLSGRGKRFNTFVVDPNNSMTIPV